MARKADKQRLQQAAQILHAQPGYKPGEYAQKMGCHRQTFNRLLVQLNDRGVLISEDDFGRLWPFDEKNQNR
jgi:hypothetical protein